MVILITVDGFANFEFVRSQLAFCGCARVLRRAVVVPVIVGAHLALRVNDIVH